MIETADRRHMPSTNEAWRKIADTIRTFMAGENDP
jgi:hypothetical protein